MPRKAPDKVIEHRIALSNFERQQIVEQLTKNRDNQLIAAGINQVGAIAGSSLLLYGALAYLGINLFKDAKDAIDEVIDNTSTTLADMAGDAIGVPLDTATAQGIINAFDRLDEAIKYHKSEERANATALTALTDQLRRGDITFNEFKTQGRILADEGQQLDYLRHNILTVRQYVRNVRTFKLTPPAWLGLKDWRMLILSALAEGNPYGPASSGQYTKPVSDLLQQ